MVKLYREADVSLTVIPFTGDDNCILDHEDSIPTDEDQIKKWVVNISNVGNKIQFTMKFSTIRTFKALSGPIFAWMKKNNSWVTMDTIPSEKISTIGFFQGLHPDFQNRMEFKRICSAHIKKHS